MNWLFWWKCLDCLDWNEFFWCSECGHSRRRRGLSKRVDNASYNWLPVAVEQLSLVLGLDPLRLGLLHLFPSSLKHICIHLCFSQVTHCCNCLLHLLQFFCTFLFSLEMIHVFLSLWDLALLLGRAARMALSSSSSSSSEKRLHLSDCGCTYRQLHEMLHPDLL